MAGEHLTKRQRLMAMKAQLDADFSSFQPLYRDLGDFMLPNRPRFYTTDVNKGDRRNLKIIDNTAGRGLRTLSSGMMSGLTSPARPWFRLGTPDPSLGEFGRVKDWLHFVSQRMSTLFLKSNLYQSLPVLYKDAGGFGTGALLIEEDLDSVFRTETLPIGSYRIAKDAKGRVNVFMREFSMTIRQVVEEFGVTDPNTGKADFSNFSTAVKHAWDSGNSETRIDVCHFIYPNPQFDARRPQWQFKKYIACYFESGSQEDKYLREGGHEYFPVLCPRWEVNGGDVYGTDSPGIQALGDTKALQLLHRRKAELLEKKIRPPMTGPSSLLSTKVSILPGDLTIDDSPQGTPGFRPAHMVTQPIGELLEDIQEHQKRIDQAMYSDLFLAVINNRMSGTTAREIQEVSDERFLQLGPVLEQLNQDLYDPLIDIAYLLMARRPEQFIPEIPDELDGVDLKVEYVSVMAQAQKLVGLSSIERVTGFIGQLAQFNPEVLDKIDLDQTADLYSDTVSAPPGMIRSDDAVALIRGQRAQNQAAAQQAASVQAAAATAKDLADTSLEGDTALAALAGGGAR